MIHRKAIIHFGFDCTIACDRQCNKAWGITNRPTIQLDDNDKEDYAWLSDGDLLEAPSNPGTYEDGEGKPLDGNFNQWCIGECERSRIFNLGEPIELPNFTRLRYNQPWKHEDDPVYGQDFFENLLQESKQRMAELREGKEPVLDDGERGGTKVTTEIIVRRLAIERDISVYEAAKLYCEMNNLSRRQWDGPSHWIVEPDLDDDIEF